MTEATVVAVAPLTVRLKGTTVDQPARGARLAASLGVQVGDDVLVAYGADRRYWLVSA